ncbi:HWE histidine kinase domain-containing protein [Gymnodinialimonas ceratoperidinii]|uniref:histidine kinase n=1 Tax=Gymnodinialimonas ceratoperidinii TaxID=2856823 RepID=A0A8F6YAS9_9RHOB|nr:HWE histidine kinase domain-containing protein [Gymnodinialimonas ceratoperidinii]QXT39351.1 response regulator [Gymnodinialimonas ceratoperidinii]
MAERVQNKDWTITTLGPAGAWSPALHAARDVVLGTDLPMALICAKHCAVVAYNDAYLACLNGRAPELGCDLSEIFLDVEDVVAEAVAQAFRGEASSLKTTKFDQHFSPVRDENGDVVGALILPVARTDGARDIVIDDLAISRASVAKYNSIFEGLEEGLCVVEVNLDNGNGQIDYRVVEANSAFYDNTGFPREILGAWLRKAAPDLEEHWYEIYGDVARSGEPKRFEENSEFLGRSFDVFAFRIDEAKGLVAILFRDNSEHKKHQKHNELLLREVNHRAKNLLSLVLAIARQTEHTDAEDFLRRFGNRLRGLAASQDVLVNHTWRDVPLIELVHSQLVHFAGLVGDRILIEGGEISLSPDAAQTVGMALHELATNASKYGALSDDDGEVTITWSIGTEADPKTGFQLTWKESGGPAVSEPEKTGFGYTVTTDMVEMNTGGKVTARYEPEGFVWQLDCENCNLLTGNSKLDATDSATAPPETATERHQPVVLIVEDEALVAADMAFLLKDEGYGVLGPVGSVKGALALLDKKSCDGAVLDVNLGRETSEPIAARLTENGTPFIVLSGYSAHQLPEGFRGAPLVDKPVRAEELTQKLETLLAAEDDGS